MWFPLLAWLSLLCLPLPLFLPLLSWLLFLSLLVPAPVHAGPAHGVSSPVPGPSGQVQSGRVASAIAPAPAWMEDLTTVLRELTKKRKVSSSSVAASSPSTSKASKPKKKKAASSPP